MRKLSIWEERITDELADKIITPPEEDEIIGEGRTAVT